MWLILHLGHPTTVIVWKNICRSRIWYGNDFLMDVAPAIVENYSKRKCAIHFITRSHNLTLVQQVAILTARLAPVVLVHVKFKSNRVTPMPGILLAYKRHTGHRPRWGWNGYNYKQRHFLIDISTTHRSFDIRDPRVRGTRRQLCFPSTLLELKDKIVDLQFTEHVVAANIRQQ